MPAALRTTARWILWRWALRNGALVKMPTRPSADGNCSAFGPSNWMTFDDAVERLRVATVNNTWESGGGVGFVFDGSEDDLGGVDLDGVLCPITGRLAGWAREIVDRYAPTYVEVSPSGTGLHIYAFGAPERISPTSRPMPRAVDDPVIEGKDPFLEAYVTKRFFTVTGNRFCGDEVTRLPAAWEWLAGRLAEGRRTGAGTERSKRGPRSYADVELDVVRNALFTFTSDNIDRNVWVGIGVVLKATFGEDAFEVYAAWMAQSPNDDAEATQVLWDGLPDEAHSMTLGTIFWLAEQQGWEPPWRRGGLEPVFDLVPGPEPLDFNVEPHDLDFGEDR